MIFMNTHGIEYGSTGTHWGLPGLQRNIAAKELEDAERL
jgi:hypothetical protein